MVLSFFFLSPDLIFQALSLLSSDEKIQVTLNGSENRPTTIYFDDKQNLINLPIYTVLCFSSSFVLTFLQSKMISVSLVK